MSRRTKKLKRRKQHERYVAEAMASRMTQRRPDMTILPLEVQTLCQIFKLTNDELRRLMLVRKVSHLSGALRLKFIELIDRG